MHKIIIKRFFDAAHQLPDSNNLITKQCASLHGHTYLVEVSCKGANKRSGMVVDFKAIKEVIDILDHKYINDIFIEHGFGEKNTISDINYIYPSTAENIAKFLYEKIRKEYPDLDEVSVRLCEGYKGEEVS